MFKQHDSVMAAKDLKGTITKGTYGTVAYVYDSPYPMYEVEFMDEDGDITCVLIVEDADLHKARL